jgi:hypothetical protein
MRTPPTCNDGSGRLGRVELSVAFALYFDGDSVNRALIRALRARSMDVTNGVDVGHPRHRSRADLTALLRM